MANKASIETAIGQVPEKARIRSGKRPIILQAQLEGYVVMNTPEELKQWEEDLRTHQGISLDASGMAGIAAECCSGGRSDMCELI